MLVQLPLPCLPPSMKGLNLAGTDYQATPEGTKDWRKLVAFRLKQELAAGLQRLHQVDLGDSESMWCKGGCLFRLVWFLGLLGLRQVFSTCIGCARTTATGAQHTARTTIPLTLFPLNCG